MSRPLLIAFILGLSVFPFFIVYQKNNLFYPNLGNLFLKKSNAPNLKRNAGAQSKYLMRRATVKEACQRVEKQHQIQLENITVRTKVLWILPGEKDLYCAIYKSASSSWKQHIITLYGKKWRVVHQDALKYVTRSSLESIHHKANLTEINEKYYKFTFVRHPFGRLAAFYYNKIFRNWTDERGKDRNVQMQNEIYRTVRKVDPQSATKLPTEDEFAQYFVRIFEGNSLTQMRNWNLHFRPQWLACPFCQMDFEVIGKLETYKEDFDYLVNKLNIKDQLGGGIHKNRRDSSKPKSADFYSKISPDLIPRLYNIYKLDFEMFGYSLEDWMENQG